MLPDDKSTQGPVRVGEDQALLKTHGASNPPITVLRLLFSAGFLLRHL